MTKTDSESYEAIAEAAAYLWVWLETHGCTDPHAYRAVEQIRHQRDLLVGKTNLPFEEARADELAYIEQTFGRVL